MRITCVRLKALTACLRCAGDDHGKAQLKIDLWVGNMTTAYMPLRFDQTDLALAINALSEDELDQLDFGVIGFDDACSVCLYNKTESKLAGLSRERVVGMHLFNVVAPCMNNFMVAQRFQDALENGVALDDSLDYVFTLRMRPLKVRLRLLSAPALKYRYVLVQRAA